MGFLLRRQEIGLIVALLILSSVTLVFSYGYFTKVSIYDQYYGPLNGGPLRSWIPELSIWWSLSPGDRVQLTMTAVDPTVSPSNLLFNISILKGIAPTTLQTAGLIQSWNLSWAQWMNYPNRIFDLSFNASHYYNIQLSMYNNSSALTNPILHYTIFWHDPASNDIGTLLLSLGIALAILSIFPIVWNRSSLWRVNTSSHRCLPVFTTTTGRAVVLEKSDRLPWTGNRVPLLCSHVQLDSFRA